MPTPDGLEELDIVRLIERRRPRYGNGELVADDRLRMPMQAPHEVVGAVAVHRDQAQAHAATRGARHAM
jgi:hypothetical protein